MSRIQYRARAGNGDPLLPGEGSYASRGEKRPQEEKNHQKAAGYPGDPGLPGVFCHPSPENRGGGGVRARVGLGDPGICGGVRR